MQVPALNERARRKYGEFVSAMDLVAEALGSVEGLIRSMTGKARPTGWTVSTPAELREMRQRAFDGLDTLRTRAKKYEAELISRDWRL